MQSGAKTKTLSCRYYAHQFYEYVIKQLAYEIKTRVYVFSTLWNLHVYLVSADMARKAPGHVPHLFDICEHDHIFAP